jgi:hypothetical protein
MTAALSRFDFKSHEVPEFLPSRRERHASAPVPSSSAAEPDVPLVTDDEKPADGQGS